MAEPAIKKALKYENYFINDSRMRRLYEMKEDGIRDYISGVNEAKREGRAEGRAEGIVEGRAEGRAEGIVEGQRKKAVQIAQKLLLLNMDLDTICSTTGLSIEDINNLNKGTNP